MYFITSFKYSPGNRQATFATSVLEEKKTDIKFVWEKSHLFYINYPSVYDHEMTFIRWEFLLILVCTKKNQTAFLIHASIIHHIKHFCD